MKLAIIVLCVSLAAAQWVPDPALGFNDVGHSHRLNPMENYWISWDVIEAKDGREDAVQIAIAVNTPGWVGFGLSESGGMKGADIVVVRQEPIGGPYQVFDMHSYEYDTPEMDTNQDWVLIATREANGEQLHILERLATVCTDDHHDMSFIDIEQRFIFSFGLTQFFAYHGRDSRSTFFVNFLADDPTVERPDLPFFDVAMPGYEIPQATDSYICYNHSFAVDLSRFYHVVAVEPFNTVPGFSHHAVTATCAENEWTLPPADQLSPEGTWSCPGSPSTQTGCGDNYIGWSVGQGIQYFPEAAGLPLGGGIAETIIIQMHSNNPSLLPGIRDTSAFRLWYTAELRQYTAILGGTGLVVSSATMTLPPQQPKLERPTQCPSGCTELMSGPARAFSIMFHMHETGHSLILHHLRNGVELRRLGVDHWDYNWQGFQEIEEFDILPGDNFFTECNFNTMNRTEPTYGGEGTQDEMCFAWIYTYGTGYFPQCFGLNTYTGANSFSTFCSLRLLPFSTTFEDFTPVPGC